MAGERRSYEILVNNQIYRFTSTDSEEHVRDVERRINEVIDHLTQMGQGHQLSDFAMKVALALADSAARAHGGVQEEDLRERFQSLLGELDSLLQNP